MRLDELLAENHEIIFEYGRVGFPGFGAGVFRQAYYQYMAVKLQEITDAPAREWLTDWLCEAFRRDNPSFKPSLFTSAVADGKNYSARPIFQQRQFYYLAHLVQQIEDQHVHDFVQNWLADVAGGTNAAFKPSLWYKFCARPDDTKAPDVKKKRNAPVTPAADEEIDEGTGAPGFGSRGHGGFGQKIFRRAHYLYIAWYLSEIADPAVSEHLTRWFCAMFKLDNPTFRPDVFEQAVMSAGSSGYGPPRGVVFQQRHFYYMAHEVAEIADEHERKFVCDWLGHALGRTNEHFNEERWEKYCNLDNGSGEVRYVQKRRAIARGDENIPEDPWEQRQRERREAGTQISRDEFDAAGCTVYLHGRSEIEGRLQYFRLPDNEIIAYDPVTRNEPYVYQDRNRQAA